MNYSKGRQQRVELTIRSFFGFANLSLFNDCLLITLVVGVVAPTSPKSASPVCPSDSSGGSGGNSGDGETAASSDIEIISAINSTPSEALHHDQSALWDDALTDALRELSGEIGVGAAANATAALETLLHAREQKVCIPYMGLISPEILPLLPIQVLYVYLCKARDAFSQVYMSLSGL